MVESIVTVVLEVVKCLAPPTERQISYLRSYNNNLDNLKNEIEKLKDDSASVQHAVDEAKRKGEEIEDNVEKWLTSVNKLIDEAHNFAVNEAAANNRCLKGLCPNLKTRHQHSKEAVRLLEAIRELREAGRFDRISYRTIPEDIQLMSNKDYEAFESRLSILKNIHAALKNPDVNILGIYGMGGIGKTTLAKEVARQAAIDKLFDQVVFAEVSQSQDIRKIQGEIADKLGLTLHEESESGRARSLYNRLKKEKKMLLILDNIWENLDLQAVGIPRGDDHKGCKVLLTARSEDTLLRKMDSQQNFLVGVLDKRESWSLFKKMAGDYIEDSEIKSVAVEVANECAGLPVSIVTVAKALRKKELFEWNDALQQLRRPSSTNFKNVQPAAYSAIELSYNKLEEEELKKIFLLIGYTYVASTRDLMMYGVGLGLFQGIDRMEEARARVRSLIRKLKASCILRDHNNGNEEWFSMHDVVRDVAISIASGEQNVFTATGELANRLEWSSESGLKLYTSIVLADVKTNVLHENLECPQLKLFYVRAVEQSLLSTISDNYFMKMIQVRVLHLINMNVPSLPSSLGLLSNLRTLCLYDCKLQDIAGIGGLKKLVFLCLRNSEIEQLFVEIGQLTQLKLLDLRGCWKLKVIPPNVLSNLSHLEELYIDDQSFKKWGEEVEGLKNASLDELKNLRNLTSIELCIKDVNTLPRGLFFEKLERYKIFIGNRWYGYHTCCRIFQLELNTNTCLKDGLIVQLQGIEDLCLGGLREQDVKNFVDELVKVGSSQMKMKHLVLRGCYAPNPRELKESVDDIILEDEVNVLNPLFIQKVVLPNLKTLQLCAISNIDRIWPNQVVAMTCGFQKLTRLILHDCKNLRYLSSSSIVTSFVQLQHLEIENCPILKEIIVMDQVVVKNIMFPRLEILYMKELPKLSGFCSKEPHIEFPSLKELWISDCSEFMVKYKSTNQDLTTKKWKESTSDMQLTEIILEDDVNVSTLFNEKFVAPNLKTLQLYKLNIERIWLFPSSIISSFIQLEVFQIKECPLLEEIIAVDRKESNEEIFPQLKFLKMKNLPKLTIFFQGDLYVEFPSMKKLKISGCPKFIEKYKSTTDDLMKKVFPNLKDLRVEANYIPWICQFSEDYLRKLKCLYVTFEKSTTILSLDDFLQRLPNVKIISVGGHAFGFSGESNLNGLTLNIREVKKCCDLKHILKKESSISDNLEMLLISGCYNLINLVPSSTSFQNLTTLKILSCKGLRNVLTTSTSKSLMRLREMGIGYCNMITEIVADDEGDTAAKDEIVFSELKELVLFRLDSVTSFCSGICAFKFPSLEKLVVGECPNMKVFSGGELSTPKLDKVQMHWAIEDPWIWESNLNTTIQKLYRKIKEAN